MTPLRFSRGRNLRILDTVQTHTYAYIHTHTLTAPHALCPRHLPAELPQRSLAPFRIVSLACQAETAALTRPPPSFLNPKTSFYTPSDITHSDDRRQTPGLPLAGL